MDATAREATLLPHLVVGVPRRRVLALSLVGGRYPDKTVSMISGVTT